MKTSGNLKKIIIALYFSGLLFNFGAKSQSPKIVINGDTAAVMEIAKFPYWLNTGARLAKGNLVLSIPVLEYNINVSTGGNDLVFNQVILVSSEQTVPANKAWKVESVIVDKTAATATGSAGDNWGGQSVFTNATLTGGGITTSPLGIAQQGATAGQVLQWNGSAWIPADASAHTDTTLTGDGTTGNPFGLAQQSATTGQVLQWNGTAWVPAYVGWGSSNMVFTMTGNKTSVTSATGFNNIIYDPLTLTVTRVSGNTFPVNINVSGLPTGVSCFMNPGGGYPNFACTVGFYCTKTTVTGAYPITFTATDGVTSQTVNITLNVVTGKRVFITNVAYQGNFGGLATGDNICKGEANNTANYIAWLSSSTVDAKNRIPDAFYFKDSLYMVATSKADLTDAAINSAINRTFSGGTPASFETWTGTETTGLKNTNTCSNWTSNSTGVYAMAGRGYQTDSQWTATTTGWNCSSSFRLYCFEP